MAFELYIPCRENYEGVPLGLPLKDGYIGGVFQSVKFMYTSIIS